MCVNNLCNFGTPTPPAFDGGYNLMFVSSQTVIPGALSSVEAADTFCNGLARDAGLSGSFRAWLSSDAGNAPARLQPARGWTRVDRLPFTDSLSSLLAGVVYYPPNLNERGEYVGNVDVVTGTSADGRGAATTCENWTQTGSYPSPPGTLAGESNVGSGAWTDLTGVYCNASVHLYCFEDDTAHPLTFTKAQGRTAFLSHGGFMPGDGGITLADAQCQAEARAAGQASPERFLALLATSTAPASARFDAGGPPWVRLDGVALASTAAAFLGNPPSLLSALDVDSTGAYVSTNLGVFTGAASPAELGTATCGDWTSPAYSSVVGGLVAADGRFFSTGGYVSCSSGSLLYCLEN
jgi:hypothetical protein